MKVPLQQVPATSLSSPISASPPCADSNAVTFASAMQSLMQSAAPVNEPPVRIIAGVPGDHAKQEMSSEPGIRTWINGQPTQHLSRSSQTAATSVVIFTPETSSANESEITEP